MLATHRVGDVERVGGGRGIAVSGEREKRRGWRLEGDEAGGGGVR